MTYVVEVSNGIEERICEVVNLYDRFSRPTRDPSIAVSGVLRLGPGSYLDFDPTIVEMFTVH